jgi:hypothetical protein
LLKIIEKTQGKEAAEKFIAELPDKNSIAYSDGISVVIGRSGKDIRVEITFHETTWIVGEKIIDEIINDRKTFDDEIRKSKNTELSHPEGKNFTLYFWWSDLPVYRTADIIPFFKMICYDSIVWEHFDYIIYQYYLILCHDFKIIDTTPITNINWSLEMLFTDNIDILNKLVDINYGFSWNTKRLYNLNKEFINGQKGFLIYHLDR